MNMERPIDEIIPNHKRFGFNYHQWLPAVLIWYKESDG
jgi:hypothetical protein